MKVHYWVVYVPIMLLALGLLSLAIKLDIHLLSYISGGIAFNASRIADWNEKKVINGRINNR